MALYPRFRVGLPEIVFDTKYNLHSSYQRGYSWHLGKQYLSDLFYEGSDPYNSILETVMAGSFTSDEIDCNWLHKNVNPEHPMASRMFNSCSELGYTPEPVI